jgi:hypothetical protein
MINVNLDPENTHNEFSFEINLLKGFGIYTNRYKNQQVFYNV